MKAIDTNVLVRIVVDDDELQARRALKFIKKSGEVFISQIVLCELAWVLEACYDLKKSDIYAALEKILRTNQFLVENSDVVWAAMHEYKKFSIDFADCLIGAIARSNDCKNTGTFDKKASKSDFFELI